MQVGLTLERAGDHGGESIRLLAAMEEWADGHGGRRGRTAGPTIRTSATRLGRAAAENEVTHPDVPPVRLDPRRRGDCPGSRGR